jgi:thiol-disulfide isomerase/thioredoxin
MSHLLEFYGDECPHCDRLRAVLNEVEEKEKIKVERLEIWHNPKNEKLMLKYDQGFCGGVPFLFNKKTGKWICGEAKYEELKDWALGE